MIEEILYEAHSMGCREELIVRVSDELRKNPTPHKEEVYELIFAQIKKQNKEKQ